MTRFPSTAWSVISRATRSQTDASRAALASLCEAYWYPLYSYARASGLPQDDARDVTQGFIVLLLEKNSLQKVRSREGRFRCFLLASFRNFLSKERDREGAMKRGGGLTFLSLDDDEAEARRGTGRPEHEPHLYLTEAEKGYLASLGVDADPLLDAMNAQRKIAAPPATRNYLEHFADFRGLIKHPVLTVHAVMDELHPVVHESAYRKTIAAAGRDDLLVQAYTSGVGFCGVNPTQQFAAIQAIEQWVKSGIRPSPSGFPAALGFIPGFEPPDWPQP